MQGSIRLISEDGRKISGSQIKRKLVIADLIEKARAHKIDTSKYEGLLEKEQIDIADVLKIWELRDKVNKVQKKPTIFQKISRTFRRRK